MKTQRSSSDPEVFQKTSARDPDPVQVDSAPDFDPGLDGCSVWWVLREHGETDGGIPLVGDAGRGYRLELEARVRTEAAARGHVVMLWLCYQKEEQGQVYERPAAWGHPSGRVVWSRSWAPGRSPADGPGVDGVQVLASLGQSEAQALGDTLCGARPPAGAVGYTVDEQAVRELRAGVNAGETLGCGPEVPDLRFELRADPRLLGTQLPFLTITAGSGWDWSQLLRAVRLVLRCGGAGGDR